MNEGVSESSPSKGGTLPNLRETRFAMGREMGCSRVEIGSWTTERCWRRGHECRSWTKKGSLKSTTGRTSIRRRGNPGTRGPPRCRGKQSSSSMDLGAWSGKEGPTRSGTSCRRGRWTARPKRMNGKSNQWMARIARAKRSEKASLRDSELPRSMPNASEPSRFAAEGDL